MSVAPRLHIDGDVVENRYEIRDFVGQGGMQQVYRAYDRTLDRIVALKCPKTPSAEGRFKRSAELSARVNHPNVAATLDYVTDRGLQRPYLIEEFIDGQDLSEYREKLPLLDPYLVAHVMHHLARAVEASHNADVFHRDLKPNNIMVSNGFSLDFLKITDFGIAKMAQEEVEAAVMGGEESMRTSSTVITALAYMAPELIQTPRKADKPADVWAIGAICFDLLCDVKPFGEGLPAVAQILTAARQSFPRRLRTPQFAALAAELLGLIDRCLTKDPALRITAADLRRACDRLCYPETRRVTGRIARMCYSTCGFIAQSGGGEDLFYHEDSVYGPPVGINDEVCIAHYQGNPQNRAHPVVKLA